MSIIFIIVILYEIFSVVGVGLYLARKNQGKDVGFSNANQSLGVIVTGITIALTYLGSLHVFGVMEVAWNRGFSSIWVSVGHVTLICVICLTTGRWVRRLGVGTVPEMMEQLFGRGVRIATSCANAAVVFGMLTMEAQCIGIVFAALTGCSIVQGTIIGGIFGMLYVLLAGMEQIGLVNVVNTVVMYTGLIVAALTLGGFLPDGWTGVQDYYVNSGQAELLKTLGTPSTIIAFGVPTVICTVFSQGISQQGLQVCMASKSEKTVFKSMILAAGLNGIFTILTVGIGVAAKSIPELQQYGATEAGPQLIVQYFPSWLVTWLCAGFLGALLSTFATNVMAPASMFVQDILILLKLKDATPKQEARYTRIFIIILSGVAVVASFFLPTMVDAANWLFSWLIPIFWITIYGLCWKRSKMAVQITLYASWIVNLLWSFTPLPGALGMEGVLNGYVTLAISLVIGIIAHLALPGTPGLFSKKVKASLSSN